jgi:hypothetical protein
MATVRLQLRGFTVPHLVAAGISALPVAYVAFQMGVHHARPTALLIGLSAAVAFLPWLSRGLARATYRAKCDDVAVHVRGEALPYKTIKELQAVRTPRRRAVRLIRSEEIWLELVLWDAFAGRLEPIDELRRRLAAHGLTLPD